MLDRSHALRGNAAPDAPRPALREGDAERHKMHSHTERGNDQKRWSGWSLALRSVPGSRDVVAILAYSRASPRMGFNWRRKV
ncbi:hypothetical protein METHPM2_430010 [Pseudomonas sp. PM2]